MSSFSVHTFETNPTGGNYSFAFHETLGEGRELYFLAKFDEDTVDSRSFAEAVFGTMVDAFKNSSIADSYDLFEDALKVANLEIQKRKAQVPRNPEIVVTFFDFHNLYLSQSGESEAYLVRGANVSQITENSPHKDILFTNILSGQVAVEDTVIIASSRLLRIVTAHQLVDIFERSDFSESVSLFKHELSAHSNESILVTAIGIGKKEKSKTAGFLSRVVATKSTKKKESPAKVASSSNSPKTEDKTTPTPTEEEQKTPVRKIQKTPPFLRKDIFSDCIAWLKKNLNIANIFKNFDKNSSQKNLTVVAGSVLILFLLGIGVKFLLQYESENTKEIREKLSIAREALKQADRFLFEGERQSAAEALKKAEDSIKIVLNSSSKEFRSDARFVMADVQDKKLQIENARTVDPQLLADLGVKNDNVEAVGMNEIRGNLYVHDRNQSFKTIRNIVEKGIPVGSNEVIVTSTTRPDQNTILYYTDTPRVIEYRDGTISPMTTEDDAWKKGIDVQTYGRFTYVLDPVENQIWKYERQRSSYSNAAPYNQSADLSRAVSMTIDGFIYVLSDDGTLQKLLRGQNEQYAFRDLPSVPFEGKNLKILTWKGHDFLYLLDPDNSRVLVFTKGERFATYKKQVIYDIPGVVDFYVNDSGQKVNVLTKDKIYEFSL